MCCFDAFRTYHVQLGEIERAKYGHDVTAGDLSPIASQHCMSSVVRGPQSARHDLTQVFFQIVCWKNEQVKSTILWRSLSGDLFYGVLNKNLRS